MATISLLRQLARTQRFMLGVPADFTVAADGSTVLFLRSRAGDDPVTCLWALDPGSGAERLLADPAELPGGAGERLPEAERIRRERDRSVGAGIVGYAADDAAALAAFALSGALWTVDVPGHLIRRLGDATAVVDPRPDPTGQRIAYVADGSLRVIEADGTGDRALAEPDGPDVTFGLPEHVAAESMLRTRGYWWAPDGQQLLVARVDSAPVGLWYIGDPADPGKPPQAVRYPSVGTANADVTLWVTGLDGARTLVRWDRDAYEYVPAAGWDHHGPFLTVLSRDQQSLSWLGIDPATGGTWPLGEQHDDCWVQLVPGLPARLSDGALVSHADRLGTRYLTVNGRLVTNPGLQLRAVVSVDRDGLLFTASPAEDPTQTELWSYEPGQGGPGQLSAEPGVHTGVRRGGTLVYVARRADRPGSQITVQRADGPAVPVASLAEPPVLGLHATRLVLGPRELRSVLFLPSWYREGDGKLPVLLDPYAGPGLQKVTAEQGAMLFWLF
jgi:dipeptidyl-peptidase-4